ncbi:MAG: hypothetical protein AAGF75_09670, partial [Cyanobacteria bacterium P01_H01_bin.130]
PWIRLGVSVLASGGMGLGLVPDRAIATPSTQPLQSPLPEQLPKQWVIPEPESPRSPRFPNPASPSSIANPVEADPVEADLVETDWPNFGSPRLNEQLRHYWRYVQILGPPDVLIVGSSRALQGLDPHVLSHQLYRQGYGRVRVYNFGINGATAQVVRWLLLDLIGRDRLPPLILWPKGSRAFNNGRPDRTYLSIANSPGYRQLQQGWRPPWSTVEAPLPPNARRTGIIPNSTLTFNGFLRDQRKFHPPSYYAKFPKVAGQFDGSYVPFVLNNGPQIQAVRNLAQELAQRPDSSSLVLINLPLSRDFLDRTRRRYEQQFQRFLGTIQAQSQWQLRDYLDLWRTQDGYFADPSHINLWGAGVLARRLAADTTIPWPASTSPQQ